MFYMQVTVTIIFLGGGLQFDASFCQENELPAKIHQQVALYIKNLRRCH